MGKIITKTVNGMGLKSKITLVLLFTLLFSAVIYNGWYRAAKTDAGIAQLQGWTNIYHSGTAPAGNVGSTFAASAGVNRMLLVAVTTTESAAATKTIGTVSYGGTAMTTAVSDAATSARQHSFLFYLPLGSNVSADTAKQLAVTISGGTTMINDVYYAIYTGVDQTSAPTSTQNLNTGAALRGINSTARFATPLLIGQYDQTAVISNFITTSGAQTYATGTMPTGWTSGAGMQWTTRNASFGSIANTTWAAYSMLNTTTSPWMSNAFITTIAGRAARVSMSGISLKAAAVTLGAGVPVSAAANVAPATTNKLDGFSVVTTGYSTGQNDTITGLTVTTTNPTAIASLAIYSEDGLTQYYTTVTNPATTTSTFSGGTGITATSTVTNYKIMVTYKNRASLTAGNFSTTATVTGITPTYGVQGGSDTVDPALTVLNTHNPITWGTNTASTNKAVPDVTLNWSYSGSTTGRGAVIVRYTGNTDAATLTDGTSYSYGNTSVGSNGIVVYSGTGTTYTDSQVISQTTYYYKIFESDGVNYYDTTLTWSAALKPISSDTTPPTVNTFAATTPVNSTTIPITDFTASDTGGASVDGYMITTSATPPAYNNAGWVSTPPASYIAAGQGSYTLYPWARDSANNVSAVYGTPVAVVVDLTAPTVTAFTLTTPVASRNIPVASFTGSDTGGSGLAAYLLTTSITQPAFDAQGWQGTAPTSLTVVADGIFTVYPWVKDGAKNVSTLFGSPRTVLVDTTPPTRPYLSSPADGAIDQALSVTLSVSAATDAGVGGVQYYFDVTGQDVSYSANSGWQSGTSYAPAGLQEGYTYNWTAKAKDSLGNETAFETARSFTTQAPCQRGNPLLTLLNSSNSKATTITTDGGTASYNMKIKNGDFGSCGSTTFSLAVNNDENLDGSFTIPSLLSSSSVTLNPGKETTVTVTVRAKAGETAGVARTRVISAADAYHLSITSNNVQTTLNVVSCTAQIPYLIIGPDKAYVNNGGQQVYTITVKNTDSGAGCLPVTYNLTKVDSDPSSALQSSVLSAASISLNSGEQGSFSLTITAKSSAVKGQQAVSTLSLAASGHTSPADKTATTTIGNPMLHNSGNTASTKWSGAGGWGLPGTKYGEFVCNTCHVDGYSNTNNIKRVNESIATPDTSKGTLPGDGKSIVYNRMASSNKNQGSLGFDSTATPRAGSTKICEACHTYDATRTNGVMAHPYATGATLGNHFGTDGVRDCVFCHKHNQGFGYKTMMCNSCHGASSYAGTIDASNRYLAAPPETAYTALTGGITGVGQVSNNPKVGAHQTHLRLFNGFTNYSTIDYRCGNCHSGSVPSDFVHADGTSSPVFANLAIRNGASPTFNSGNLTCSNTYCHNPAGAGILASANKGNAIQPSWTSATLLAPASTKSVANCSKCHLVPDGSGANGFTFQGSHGTITTDTQPANDCSGCHGHNGDATGAVGQRHMDGIRYAAGYCNSCHSYDTKSGVWGTDKPTDYGGFGKAIGAHAKHIDYLKTRYTPNITLDPVADSTAGFGAGQAAKICGVCHTNDKAKHMVGDRVIDFGGNSSGGNTDSTVFGTVNQKIRLVSGTAALYNGSSTTSTGKTCSNLSCHYFTTPDWNY